MAKITRYDGNFKAFGSDATGAERTVFGSTTQTDDLTTNLGAEYQRGWGVLPSGQKPPKQYFNGALFGTSQAVAYLHQAGVAEWNGEQEYHAGSITNRNGQIFVCLTDDHVSATTPENDPTNWSNDDTIINNDNTPNLISAGTRKSWTKGVAAFTGIIAIEITGLYNQSAMNGVMEVDLMEVGNTKHFRKLVIHGQWNNGTSAWDYGFANDIIGEAATQVRFARNPTTSKAYVLLGETTTAWTDTRVVISVPVSSWNSGLNLGFVVSTLGSLTGITTDFNISANQAVNFGQINVANSAPIKTALNASGNAPIYACRAWVNFNGTGTVAIRASGNVSSITDNGTGDYTVNFTTAMPDANYCLAYGGCGVSPISDTNLRGFNEINNTARSTSLVRVKHMAANSVAQALEDADQGNISIFR